MRKTSVSILVLTAGLLLALGPGLVAQKAETSPESTHSSQRALFIVYLAKVASIDTGMSISNVLAAPPGIQEVFDEFSQSRQGTVEFYLWDYDGDLMVYETGPDSPGAGLSPSGTLGPGQTYLVLLSEILAAAGYPEKSFTGYGWLVANFEGVQGSCNVTDFSTFGHPVMMQPDLGSSVFDFDASAGIPISFLPEPK